MENDYDVIPDGGLFDEIESETAVEQEQFGFDPSISDLKSHRLTIDEVRRIERMKRDCLNMI